MDYKSKEKEYLFEGLAALAHSQWSGWMTHLFGKCLEQPDGSIVIPVQLAERWKRQVRTEYKELSEAEKDSDRRQAEKFISFFCDGVNQSAIEKRISDVTEIIDSLEKEHGYFVLRTAYERSTKI